MPRCALLLLCCCVLGGCASTSSVTGARDQFKQKLSATKQVTLAPLYATSRFGMEAPAHTAVLELYEALATQWLQARGISVTSSRAFTQALTQQGQWDAWVNGLGLTRALEPLFEKEDTTRPEVSFMATFAKNKHISPTPVLFMELAYHTQGMCYEEASDEAKHTFTLRERPSNDVPSPCLLSHLHAKLVDPQTGLAMWYNHAFGEFLVATPNAKHERTLMAAVVARTLGEERGLR